MNEMTPSGESKPGLTPDEEVEWERHMNERPPQTADEVMDDMARTFGETLTEALKHIENLLDVADNRTVSDDEARDVWFAARKFWNEMNPPDKYDDADDPRYR